MSSGPGEHLLIGEASTFAFKLHLPRVGHSSMKVGATSVGRQAHTRMSRRTMGLMIRVWVWMECHF